MRFKATLAVLLALSLFLTACGTVKTPPETTAEPTVSQETTQATEETLAPLYTRPAEDEQEFVDSDEPAIEGDQDGDTDGDQSDSDDSVGSAGGADSGDTFADGGVTSAVKGNAVKLTWSAIRSYPIKSSTMSVSQMRQLCVDFFRFAKTALWTPDRDISYIRNAAGSADSMTGGILYGGLPYVGSSSGNIYRLMDYLDESTGRVNMGDMLELTGGQLQNKDLIYFGNQCANGAYVGWGRVINSVEYHYTASMTKANGYIPLGDYTYDTNRIQFWSAEKGYRTTDVVKANGEQVMYQAYAKLQPADGLVYYTTAGHVIMAATAAHVEYVPGTDLIDGEQSYITIIDQAQKWVSQTSGGYTFQVKSSVDAKVNFKKLYAGSYLPFTFGEFTGADPVEATTCSISLSGDTVTPKQIFSAKVTSNYSVTDVYVTVTDGSGNQVYKHAVRNKDSFANSLQMAKSGANVDSWGSLPSGNYTVKIEAQLATGERPVIYTGTWAG